MWVRADGNARVSTRATEDVDDVESIEAGLARLHAMALDRLRTVEQAEMEQELARLEERDRKQTEASDRAMADLAAVLEPKAAGEVTVANPLVAATTLVGGELGIEIRPPAKSEDPHGLVDPLEAIARASRIRVRRVTLSGEWWTRDCGPLLAYSADDERRPLALLRGKKLRYYIVDPVDGTRTRLTRRTSAGLAHEAVMLYRPLPDGKLKLSDIFKFSIGNRERDLAVVVLTGIAATLLGMITPQATAVLMDQAIPDANRTFLLEIGAGLLAAAFGATTFNLTQGILLQRIGIGSEGDSQAALWDRLLRLRPSFFRQYSSGDLESRVMAVNEVGRELSGATLTSLFASFMAVLNLGLLYYYSSSLSILAVAIASIVFLFTVGMSYFIRRNLRELLELDGTFFGLVVQLINGVGKLRVAGAESRAYTHWVRKYAQMLKLRNQVNRLSDYVYVFNVVLPAVGSMLLYYFAFELLLSSRTGGAGISLGIFLAFNTAFGTFLAGIASLSGTVVGFLDTMTKGRRIQPILDEEPETDLSKADPGRLTGRLEVDEVEFAYRADGPKILDGVNLRAEPGEFIAVVGASGSGKSTLFRLLLGFETPDSGSVAFDGQELSNLDVLAVRRQLGVVLQGGKLDVGSIFENIACGNVITLDEAWAAAEDAGMAEEVREMPMGMHTIVSVGGGNLSGGQRQRLLIARALAHRPRILLFDEATSALDNRTQAIVSESLERLRVTRIVIAHRLSTIRHADRIYVLEGGRIVQTGTFDQLMREEGLFARMMARQVA
jgi:ATP-binding cassette subfamily C protein